MEKSILNFHFVFRNASLSSTFFLFWEKTQVYENDYSAEWVWKALMIECSLIRARRCGPMSKIKNESYNLQNNVIYASLHCISCSFWCKDVFAIFVSVRKRNSWRRAVIENRRLRLVSDQIYDVLEWYVYENLLDIMFVRLRTSCMFGLEGKWCQQA